MSVITIGIHPVSYRTRTGDVPALYVRFLLKLDVILLFVIVSVITIGIHPDESVIPLK